MKHTINSKKHIDTHQSLISVELIPETEIEKQAILHVQATIASDEERELVENYLNFSLGLSNYSVVDLIDQKGNTFFLKIFI